MGGSAAIWLKRALGVTCLSISSLVLGCGGVTRTFVPDTTEDGATDSGSPMADSSTPTDVSSDGRPKADGSPDVANDRPDVAIDAARDADATADRFDASVDVGNDVPVDAPWLDVGGDLVDQPPTILSTIPADATVAVAVTTTITVDFSKPMNVGTVTLALQPAVALGAPIWNATYTSVAFTPPAALAEMTRYVATVTGSDTGGRALAAPTSFTFTTGAGADTTAPAIRATAPSDNATNVPVATTISVTFTEPMDVGTVAVTAVPDIMLGMPTFDAQNTTVTFTPAAPLLPYTEYTLTVAGQDPAKNPLAAPTTFRFTTATPPDTTPPTVVAVAPPSGTTNVPSNSSIVITFSESMNVTATSGAISFLPAVTCNGGLSWNQTGTTATCVPTARLAYMTSYTVNVGVGAADTAGNALAAAYASTFTTGVAPDTTPPTIVSVQPGAGAAGVPRGAKIVVNFSEAMDINSAQAAFQITSPAGITGTFAWGVGNTQMVFTPSALYAYGATVNWQVTAAARDAAGNAKTSVDSYSFNVIKSTTSTFACIGALDGFVNSIPTAYTTSNIVAGASTYTLRGFAAFNISGLPADTTLITSASIYLYQYDVAGTPYGSTRLGDVLWRHVDYGPALESVDYNTPLLVHSGNGGILSTTATAQWKSSVVTLSVRDDFANRIARANRSEYMIRFTYDTTTPITTEYAYFYPCEATAPANRPYLSITYEHP